MKAAAMTANEVAEKALAYLLPNVENTATRVQYLSPEVMRLIVDKAERATGGVVSPDLWRGDR